MSNTDDQKAREENALDALIAAAFKGDGSEADEKEIEAYGNALTHDDRKGLDAAGKNLIHSLFGEETKKPKAENVTEPFSAAMNRGDDGGVALSDRAAEEKERNIRDAREQRKARNRPIQEHDIIRVRANVEVEGYSILAGMVGTVVSVYRNGEAFAIEFPELDRGSAVVTLYRDQVERAEGTDE